MHENLSDKITRTREEMRLYQQERAIMEVTELISGLMEEHGMTKAHLAKELGTSKANITQMLDGRRNMTIRTISDVLFCLGAALQVASAEIEELMSGDIEKWHRIVCYVSKPGPERGTWKLGSGVVNATSAGIQKIAG